TGWYQYVQRVAEALKAYDKKLVTVIVNGKEISEKGMLMNNLTYVPLRVIAAALGAKIGWDQAAKEASIDGIVIDGIVISGTTYVPLRLLGETIGAKVTWENKSKTASIKM